MNNNFADEFLQHGFWGSYNELIILSSLTRRTFNIIEVTTRDIHIKNIRNWTFTITSSNEGQSFLNNYISTPVSHHTYWLVRILESHFMPLSTTNDNFNSDEDDSSMPPYMFALSRSIQDTLLI